MRRTLIKIIKSVGYHFNDVENERTPISLIHDEAVTESYNFIRERMDNAVLFSDTPAMRRHVIDLVINQYKDRRLLLEFGVYKGRTLNLFAERLAAAGIQEAIYGFDAFEGLEEDWSQQNYPSGQFNLGGKPPKTRQNALLVKGWVQDTLDDFLTKNEGRKIAFMHIDMDTYSPTKFVLERTRDRCESGTIILFDELYGYPNWRAHEFRALNEVYAESEYDFIVFGKLQCAIRLT